MIVLVYDDTDVARFWRKVNQDGPTVAPALGQCWEWISGKFPDGYGKFWINGRSIGAHIVADHFEVGPRRADQWVLHRCDNRACVRPDHLFRGTHTDNMRDMVAKGRNVSGTAISPESRAIGEYNGRAKLSAAKVGEIRLRYERGERITDLAKEFGVSRTAIRFVVERKRWAHV